MAVFNNLKTGNPKDRFTLGIVDDVTHTFLEEERTFRQLRLEPSACKFWVWVPMVPLEQ